MKNIVLIIISFLAANYLQAQNPNFQWVKFNQGYQGNVYSNSIELDSAGNIYTIGSFSGTVDFNPSSSNATWLSSPLVGYSYYIQKLDSVGNLVWVRSVDIASGSLYKIDIDLTGRLYIIGNFEDSVDIDPGSSVHMLYSNGDYDAFVLKLSANGNFIWAKSFGGPEDDVVRDIVVDSQGNVYTHGYFKDTVDFDPGVGVCTYIAGNDAFIQKLDKDGNFVWAKTFHGSEGYTDGTAIDLDSEGNVYCTGDFFGTGIDFDPGLGVVPPPSNSSNMYFVKLDSIGSFIWARFSTRVGIGGYANPYAMVVDRFNNIFITGFSWPNIDFDPGPDTLLLTESTFIQKYDENGNFLWARSYGFGDNPMSLATDTFGNIYSTGLFQDSTDLDPGPDTLNFYTYGPYSHSYGAYIQKLNQNGDLIWAGVLAGNNGGSVGFEISTDKIGNVLLLGDYGGTVDFDPGQGTQYQTAVSQYSSSYVLKLSQCKTLTTDHITTCDSLTWMDGKTYYQSTQSAYFTLPSSAGCDSVIVLNLNIPVIDTTISVSPHGVFTALQSSASYQWLDCNNNLSAILGDTLQSFTPTQNGNYAVSINISGCVDTSACVNINNVSIEEIAGNIIKLYPNPNNGKFMLDLSNLKATEVRILNSLGQEIWIVRDINSKYFDLELNPGVYFIQIQSDNYNKTIKFVVR